MADEEEKDVAIQIQLSKATAGHQQHLKVSHSPEPSGEDGLDYPFSPKDQPLVGRQSSNQIWEEQGVLLERVLEGRAKDSKNANQCLDDVIATIFKEYDKPNSGDMIDPEKVEIVKTHLEKKYPQKIEALQKRFLGNATELLARLLEICQKIV